MLTVHLLTKDNEKTISNTLDSILPLECNIIIGDLGSTDKTVSICKGYGIKPFVVNLEGNYSAARNSLLEHSKTEWNLYLHPWELLASGHISLKNIESSAEAFRIRVLQNNVITKEIRLWRKLKFTNPVYETLIGEAEILNDPLIFSNNAKEDYEEKLRIINQWKKADISSEPMYYEILTLLSMNRYDEFSALAEKYLFSEKSGVPVVLMKYYLSLICFYIFKDIPRAYTHILGCLLAAPLMAEFWCLLGDILYNSKKFEDAVVWYENAIILGSQRLNTDEFPIDIAKYKKYPEKMIASCKEIISKSAIYLVNNTVNNTTIL